MKKIISISIFFICISSVAQNVKDAKKLLYYKKSQTAQEVLHQVLMSEPHNDEAWYLLTEAYCSQGAKDKILDRLRTAPEGIRTEPYFLAAMGMALLQQSEISEAERYFSQVLEKTKYKSPKILLAVARAKVIAEKGDANQAIDLLIKAIKKDKNNPELYTELGKAYRKLLNGTEAFKAFGQAINADKQFAEAYYLTGMIFRTQNNSDLYLEYFNKAITADPNYAPAYYQLYFHYYFRNGNTAKSYLEKYITLADHSIQNDYDYTDILYLTKNYKEAIAHATRLIETQKDMTPARIYKLIAYSYEESNDHKMSFDYMLRYFDKAPDSILIAKDFILLAELYHEKQKIDSAIFFYRVGAELEQDKNSVIKYYKTLAELSRQQKDYREMAYWLGKYYNANEKSTNIDLFNWGIAWFQSGNFQKSDSVFAIYSEKYPDQDFGHYWRARSNAAIDTSMESGLAVPHYFKVIEIGERDTTMKSKKHLIEAYGYLAGYEANQNKNYEAAIEYFEKLLQLDPDNEQAKKYVQILKETIAKKEVLTDS